MYRGGESMKPFKRQEKRLMILMFVVAAVMLLSFLRRLFV